MRPWQTNPFEEITLVRGQGCAVWDRSGKRYLDLLSGTWCNVLGYGHPRWTRAVERQLSRLIHVGAPFPTEEILDAGAKLQGVLPPALNRVVFLSTGSEAVELALKMARAATGADGIVVIEGAYYGATTYAYSLSEVGRKAAFIPPIGTIYRLPLPDCSRCPAGCASTCGGAMECLAPLEALAEEGSRRIAAVLFEPVISGAGVLVPPAGYGARLRELSARCGALLVCEEVTTGVGRTGRWFGFEREELVPDVLVAGKAIGAGFPVSAVVTTDSVESSCRGLLQHVQSHQNDPFSGRVASEVISILEEERLIEQAAARGRALLSGLRAIQARSTAIREVRGVGAIIGVELQLEKAGRGPDLVKGLLERGYIVNFQPQSRSFRLFPPYVISTEEIEGFLAAFERVLADA